MADELKQYVAIANQVILYLTKELKNWELFLCIMGSVHKYPVLDQIMVYAQMPPGNIPTAIAERDLWERGLHRKLKPQAQGMTLFVLQDGKPVGLRTVYDVAETEGPDDVRPWQYADRHKEAVSACLAARYGVPPDTPLPELLVRVATVCTDDFWKDHKNSILNATQDSLLEELDTQNIGIWFCQTMAASLSYALLSRCSQSMEGVFEAEDFRYVGDFNAQASVRTLAYAVSEQAGVVLGEIEKCIKSSDAGAA